ncbi:MAG: tRNA epoxyqueuosine(34) reductase QueG [Gammaproteobacteria bacterium]|nr:tRNA epoxyqueuosine(34) reductase QueG [Gammaproteobacteria bacterium]
MSKNIAALSPEELLQKIKDWSKELGFQQLEVTDTDLTNYEGSFLDWLNQEHHGEMDYMQKHGTMRYQADELVANTLNIISVRMDYYPPDCEAAEAVLNNPEQGYISRYALGRDYHKLMRKRLQKLASKINTEIGDFGYRVFVDSAPVLEKPLAEKAGLGWIGKHTNLINQKAGSWFFLGEIYTDLPLPVSNHIAESHCGNCQRCINVCPTKAIIAPYKLDARRCISYLTIELDGAIPVEFRAAMGNRIYGCDDCQLFCPWNRFSVPSTEKDFLARHPLDAPNLLELFAWSEEEFLKNTEGSSIRRIGYQRWQRNIAIALGNAPHSAEIISALENKLNNSTAVVIEHINWALQQQHESKSPG